MFITYSTVMIKSLFISNIHYLTKSNISFFISDFYFNSHIIFLQYFANSAPERFLPLKSKENGLSYLKGYSTGLPSGANANIPYGVFINPITAIVRFDGSKFDSLL